MDKFTEKLPQYLEDGLTETETIELEAHLADCAVCQAEFDALTRFDRLLASAPPVSPSADFVTTFETRLEHRLNRRRTIAGVLVIGTLLAGITGVLTLGVGNTVWQWLGNAQFWAAVVESLGGLATIGAFAGRVLTTLGHAGLEMVQSPVFAGYLLLSLGIVWLWVQLIRRMRVAQQTVSIN